MNIEISNQANLPTKHGAFKVMAFKEGFKEHLAIYTANLGQTPLVRIHSECLTGDTLGSLKCDCGEQLQRALDLINTNKNGGAVLYLRQEGRNIGLLNKINAYALQDTGLDTIQANHQLGFKADERSYEIAVFMLKTLKISQLELLTNNPNKLSSLGDVKILQRKPLIIKPNEFNKDYLEIKKTKSGHLL